MKKFEERLDRLEELAERIKEPDLPLEEAVAVFEEGIKLSKGLQRELDKIQGKVEILLGTGTNEEGEEKADLGLFDGEEGEQDRLFADEGQQVGKEILVRIHEEEIG